MTIFLSEDYMPAVNLNRPAIDPGPITEADLAAARQHSTGNVWLLPRRASAMQCPPCNGDCRQGRDCPGPETIPTDYSELALLDDCAIEGGKHADPVPSAVLSMCRHDRIRYRVALVLLLALACYAVHIAWPLLAT
jgi:hypothetical protein